MASQAAARSFGQWKILLVCPDSTVESELAPLFKEMLPFSPIIELGSYPGKAALGELLSEQAPNLCFVDVGSDRDRGMETLADLVALDPKLPAVALHRANDPDFILRTLRTGATEFLLRPFSAEDFVTMMERVVALHRSRLPGQSGKLWCVLPAKGACGASTLACALAFQCRKLTRKRVLLADLDPLTGTIAFQLKLRQSYSFLDALNRGATLDSDVWKGLVETIQNVDVLLSPENPVHGIDEVHQPRMLTDYARMNYDLIVADCGAVYGAWAADLARQSDEILLVTTNELPALEGAQRAIAYLERNHIDRSAIRVILNRYRKEEGLSHDLVEAALHARVFALIPDDPESAQRALVDGKPVGNGGAAGKAILSLAGKLCGTAPAPEPEKKKNGLSSLFSFFRR
jgi:pilus assembly protein CpaE